MPPAGGTFGTSNRWPGADFAAHPSGVESLPSQTPGAVSESRPAACEDVPALFRAILDLVADAERAGLREQGERARSEAIRIYARGWDDAGRRQLELIAERLTRRLASPRSRRFLRLG